LFDFVFFFCKGAIKVSKSTKESRFFHVCWYFSHTLILSFCFFPLALHYKKWCTYKQWKPGEPEPSCWKEHYRLNPCVPVDFKSISSAIETVGRATPVTAPQQWMDDDDRDRDIAIEIQSDITVWLRPGRRYVLPQAVTISTRRRTNQVRIETQQILLPFDHEDGQQPTPLPAILVSSSDDDKNNTNMDQHPDDCRPHIHDEPLFRLLRGTLILRNVHLQHYSPGSDIWHGNAAIQVQPAGLHWDQSIAEPPLPMASAILYQVQVQSASGRGMVVVRGGQLQVHDSYIHDCAATGVYVGGALSKATLLQTDIIGNGTGNRHCTIGGRSVTRGHSGVYVEQGTCELDDCSVSRNSASGIYILARAAESLLTMRKTDVLANEYNPLELQREVGRLEGGESTSFNVFDPQHGNNISPGGTPRPRSSILRHM
jgi:hypothetical protein